MAKTCWALALCLLTTSAAFAQAPRGRDADAEFGAEEDAPRGERPARGEGERGERGFGREGGEEGGRFGGGRGFRRGNPMFTAIDADADGSISKAELRKAVAALAKLDVDGDGNITQEEAGAGGPGGPGGPMGDSAQMINQIMTQDKNRDGKLTLDEVDERTAMMLQRADQNGDQAIDRAELTTAMEQMRQRFGGGPGAGGQAFGGRGGDMTERIMALDKNGDGKISTDEAPDSEQARGMLRRADEDGNGEVDAKEMEQFSRRMGGRMRGPQGEGGAGGRAGRGEEGADSADGERSERRPRRGREEAEEQG